MNGKYIAWLLATIMVLAVFATAIAPASAAGPNKTALTLNAPSSVHSLQTFDISGKLIASTTGVGVSDMRISVYRSVDGKKWSLLDTCLTDGGGYYKLSTSESTAGKYMYRASFDGNKIYMPVTSAKATVMVDSVKDTSITLVISPTSFYVGEYIPITAGLRDASGAVIEGGQQTVTIEYTDDSGHHGYMPIQTDMYGHAYTEDLALNRPGTYTFFVTYAGGNGYAPTTSNSIQVKATEIATTLTLAADHTQATTDDVVTFSGSYKDTDGTGIYGIRVVLDLYNPITRTWQYFDSTYTDGAGSYSFQRQHDAAGTYDYRTWVTTNYKYADATSNVCSLTVVASNLRKLEVDGTFAYPNGPVKIVVSAQQTDTLGNAEGTYESHGTEEDVIGQVTALSVEGDTAWIGVIITSSNYPELIGKAFYCSYRDGTPDTASGTVNADPSELLANVNRHQRSVDMFPTDGTVVIS